MSWLIGGMMGDKYVEFEEGQKYCRKRKDNQVIADTPDDFTDAGYVLKPEDFIVDIDNLPKDIIRKMIDYFGIHTQIVWTGRGAHLYFKRDGVFRRAKGTCVLGFEVEYKHYENCQAITIKLDGKMRTVENEGMRQVIPKFLQTLPGIRNLLGLDEGDGRNDALYEHKRKIAKLGNTQKILKFINENIFATPLTETEFITVSREEIFTAQKDGENEVADRIIKEKRVKFFKNSLYFFDGISYTNNENELRRMVYDYCPDQKTRYIDEVIKQMEYRSEVIPDNTEFKIKLKNGYLYKGTFYPYALDDFTPYYIPLKYDPNAESVVDVDDYLDRLTGGDESYRKFVLEIIATCLIVNPEFKRALSKFFIFVGDGGNGKGTLLQIIKTILGENNISATSISELSDERYLNNLIGKLANLGDDIENEPINRKQMKILKNLSSGDTIQVRRLNENAFMTTLNPVLIFTSNHILKTFDKDYSYKRRVVWCPMYIKPKKVDTNFISKLTTNKALEYWIRLVIEAYERIYETGGFTQSKIVREFTEKYHRENDSTIEYMEQLKDESIMWHRPPEIFEEYELWCENNGETVQSKRRLREQILGRGFVVKQFTRKSINNGVSCKVYYKESLDTKNNELQL